MIRKDLEELQFTVVAEVNECRVDFKVYDICGRTGAPDGPFIYRREGGDNSMDWVESLDDAEVYLHGSVKWDGCSDWSFDEQDRVMLHGCSRHDIERYGKIMAACWDMTKELLPSFVGD